MDLVPFAEEKLGPVVDAQAPLTACALTRRAEQPELRVHLGVCLLLYLADYPPPGTMLCDLPVPEDLTVRLSSCCVCVPLSCGLS